MKKTAFTLAAVMMVMACAGCSGGQEQTKGVLQPPDRKDTEKSLGSPQIPLYGGDTACRSGTGCPFPVQYKDRRDFPHLRRHSALHSAERNPPSSQWNYAGGFQRNPLSSGTVLRPYHQS